MSAFSTCSLKAPVFDELGMKLKNRCLYVKPFKYQQREIQGAFDQFLYFRDDLFA